MRISFFCLVLWPISSSSVSAFYQNRKKYKWRSQIAWRLFQCKQQDELRIGGVKEVSKRDESLCVREWTREKSARHADTRAALDCSALLYSNLFCFLLASSAAVCDGERTLDYLASLDATLLPPYQHQPYNSRYVCTY
jgi:hypothetical protein